jgi:hypothetical protein
MRILTIIAAAAVAAFAVPASASAPAAPAAAPAKAAQVRVVVRTGHRDRHHGYHRRAGWRQVCTTTWRHHHRVRNCHRVRYWR